VFEISVPRIKVALFIKKNFFQRTGIQIPDDCHQFDKIIGNREGDGGKFFQFS
jgi:hypothetical protein